jgi:tryptophan-rich sensory protein
MNATLITAALVPVAMFGLGGVTTEIGDWYRDLRKPSWNPPNWLFAPAWGLILGFAGWSGYLAWTGAKDGDDHLQLVVRFGALIVLHSLWSPLFFKLKRPDFSLIELPFLWLSILLTILTVVKISVLAGWLLAPYLAWVTFAAVLNLAIVRMNGPFR